MTERLPPVLSPQILALLMRLRESIAIPVVERAASRGWYTSEPTAKQYSTAALERNALRPEVAGLRHY